ncbi:hypothetical protein JW868_02470 [Candidatus Woesearchaeota archaeon]|nr:hypothetical protein [Candidatus Woesearchaeota archaeon]
MAGSSILKEVLKFLGQGGVDSIKKKVDTTVEQTKKKVELIVTNALKISAVFVIVVVGFIFALVGVSKYLSETVNALNHGLGFLVVGAVLIILALIVKGLSPK